MIPNPGYESTDLAGWTVRGVGVTHSRTTSVAHSGTASLAVTGPGGASREGVMTAYTVPAGKIPASVGETWDVYVWVRGAGTVTLRIAEMTATPGWLAETIGAPVALTGDWQPVRVRRTLDRPSVAMVSLELSTTTAQAVTFYVDDWARVLPGGITLPILRLGSPHIGPLRAGKA